MWVRIELELNFSLVLVVRALQGRLQDSRVIELLEGFTPSTTNLTFLGRSIMSDGIREPTMAMLIHHVTIFSKHDHHYIHYEQYQWNDFATKSTGWNQILDSAIVSPPIKLSSKPAPLLGLCFFIKYTDSTHDALLLLVSWVYCGFIVLRMWFEQCSRYQTFVLIFVLIYNRCEAISNAKFNEQIRDYSVTNNDGVSDKKAHLLTQSSLCFTHKFLQIDWTVII